MVTLPPKQARRQINRGDLKLILPRPCPYSINKGAIYKSRDCANTWFQIFESLRSPVSPLPSQMLAAVTDRSPALANAWCRRRIKADPAANKKRDTGYSQPFRVFRVRLKKRRDAYTVNVAATAAAGSSSSPKAKSAGSTPRKEPIDEKLKRRPKRPYVNTFRSLDAHKGDSYGCHSEDETGESRIDFGTLDEERIIPSFFSARTCYDAMPKSGKVIVLSTELLVKNAFSCLVTNEIRAAPLWESSSQTFVGMLTITDFINVLRHYYYSSQDDIKDIENQKIAFWRRITNNNRPIIKIPPNESLVSATKLLIEERIHRLPVYDERRNSVLFVISRKRLLQYLYNNLVEKFGKTYLKVPFFWKRSIGDLRSQLGTWENIATVSVNTKVIEALDVFCERKVSALPVMDADGKLVDIFAKFDVFALAKEQTYDNLDMTVAEALDKAEVHEDVYGCTVDEPLGTVIDRFVAAKVHRLVIVDERHIVIGMLSLSDLLKFLIIQPLDDSAIVSDIIEETPEGATGGQDDSSVFLSSGPSSSGNLQKSSSLEKQDSSDLSEDFVKVHLETDTPEPLSEASICEDDP